MAGKTTPETPRNMSIKASQPKNSNLNISFAKVKVVNKLDERLHIAFEGPEQKNIFVNVNDYSILRLQGGGYACVANADNFNTDQADISLDISQEYTVTVSPDRGK